MHEQPTANPNTFPVIPPFITAAERQAYNDAHGTDLREHDDSLSPTDAERVNNYYSIELYTGSHGSNVDDRHDVPDAHRTTDDEYEAVALLVDSMEPGDALFVEAIGFTRPEYPSVTEEGLTGLEGRHQTPMRQAVAEMFAGMLPIMRARQAAHLQEQREQRLITSWAYAQQLATLKGIAVVPADIDAAELEVLRRQGTDKFGVSADMTRDAQGMTLTDRVFLRREQAACNILKDYALAHLPDQAGQTPAPAETRRPRLVQLFGFGHLGSILEHYNQLGLQLARNEVLDPQGLVNILAGLAIAQVTNTNSGAMEAMAKAREAKVAERKAALRAGKRFGSSAHGVVGGRVLRRAVSGRDKPEHDQS